MTKRRIPDGLALLILVGLMAAHGLLLGLGASTRQPSRDDETSAVTGASWSASAAPSMRPELTAQAKFHSAKLELHICNRSKQDKVYAAIAAYDPALQRLVARGWFPQMAGECRAVMRDLVPPIYVYAETQDGQRQWRDQNGAEFCIRSDTAFVTSPSTCAGQSRFFRKLELIPSQPIQIWSIDEGVKS